MKGVNEARAAGRKLKAQGFKFNICSPRRSSAPSARSTSSSKNWASKNPPFIRDQALNERDYGDLVGLNNDDARKKWGGEQVHQWRRVYDVAPPNGESLKDTAARVLPHLHYGDASARHGGRAGALRRPWQQPACARNGARRHTTKLILDLNLVTGVPMIYRFNPDTTVASKLDLAA